MQHYNAIRFFLFFYFYAGAKEEENSRKREWSDLSTKEIYGRKIDW